MKEWNREDQPILYNEDTFFTSTRHISFGHQPLSPWKDTQHCMCPRQLERRHSGRDHA